MRVRITLTKTEAMRYTGHLDLRRALERAFRRAALPLAYSQGFNPRARLNLASPLPLGFTSEHELADVWLEEEVAPETVRAALNESAPPGFSILAAEAEDERAPKLPSLVEAATYLVTLPEPAADLDDRVRALLAAERIERRRRKKTYDLRPLVERLERLPDDEAGRPRLSMRLTALPGATGRPDEVLAALGLPPETARIHRTRIWLEEG